MISVIVPVYNAEHTLDTCIESILRQSESDYEIILVNDGSKDGSLSKCCAWRDKDARIKVVDKENGGVSSARNAGLDQSTGEYVCFMDSDDMIMPTYLGKLLNMIVINNAEMAICRMKKREEDDTLTLPTEVYESRELLEMILYGKISIGVCGIMVKASVIKENGLRFAEGYRYSEDLHMLWRLAHYCKKTAYTAERHYVYFDIEGSAMSKFDERRKDSLVLFDDLYEFFAKNRPDFAGEFKKYGISKNRWSFFWQAAVKLPKRDYIALCKEQNAKKYFCDLITYPSLKVSASAFAGLISLYLFRAISLIFAKKYVH